MNFQYTTDSLTELFLNYLRQTISDRIDKELQPIRDQMQEKIRKIFEEEVAKFSVNMFDLVHIDKLAKEIRITVEKKP